MAGSQISTVDAMTGGLRELLERARQMKSTDDTDSVITASALTNLVDRIDGFSLLRVSQQHDKDAMRQSYFARIETAIRNIFYSLLASTSIEQPAFARMWDLLDVVSILSDMEQCEPGLVFWLIEELLDSQTIEGCKRIFDYLESRRERITAKHFKQKHLIILRSCNELLRRLSRAENAVFCGRVFIFLFQSFPLGDKSSVNLRGEFHIENTTAFEDLVSKAQTTDVEMEVDGEETQAQQTSAADPDGSTADGDGATPAAPPSVSQSASSAIDKPTKENEGPPKREIDFDRFYPIFWSLQEHFSNPPRLFDANNLQRLKEGLELTLNNFKTLHKEANSQTTLRLLEESKRGVKRKRGEGDDYMASNFNPKYLTSRELFELEVSDLAFRRHILVQALILLDFLLSLTPKEKAKWTELSSANKSVQYQYTLSDEDAKWATETKNEIANYLQQGPEGKFYYRMVDTVLSRDKNWVRWKAESCPPIERPPVSAQEWEGARDGADKACASAIRKIRAVPLGSLDLGFLSDTDPSRAMDRLKDPQRYTVPDVEYLQDSIAEADEKIKHPKDDAEKEEVIEQKASRMWRVLRLAATTRLPLFDKLDTDVQNLQPLYRFDRLGSNHEEEEDGDVSRSGGLNDQNESGTAHENILGRSHPASSPAALQDTAVR